MLFTYLHFTIYSHIVWWFMMFYDQVRIVCLVLFHAFLCILWQEIVPKAASDIPGCCAPRTQAEDAKCKELGEQRTAWEEYDACASADAFLETQGTVVGGKIVHWVYRITVYHPQMAIWMGKMNEHDDSELDLGAPYFQANSNIYTIIYSGNLNFRCVIWVEIAVAQLLVSAGLPKSIQVSTAATALRLWCRRATVGDDQSRGDCRGVHPASPDAIHSEDVAGSAMAYEMASHALYCCVILKVLVVTAAKDVYHDYQD